MNRAYGLRVGVDDPQTPASDRIVGKTARVVILPAELGRAAFERDLDRLAPGWSRRPDGSYQVEVSERGYGKILEHVMRAYLASLGLG